MEQTVEKLTLSVPQAAKLMGVSAPKMYEIARRADFPAVQCGNRILISRKGFEAWLDHVTGEHATLE